MVLGKKENLYTSPHVAADSTLYFAPLVRLSPGVKYDIAGISISSLLILYIIINSDLSLHFTRGSQCSSSFIDVTQPGVLSL